MKRPQQFADRPQQSDDRAARSSTRMPVPLEPVPRRAERRGPAPARPPVAPPTDPPAGARTPAPPVSIGHRDRDDDRGRRRLRRLARRAERREARRFTRRSRRRRLLLWSGSGIAAVLAIMLLIGVYSPVFAIREIRVVGAERLDPVAVQQALAGQLGTPLPLVDEGAVLDVLEQFPLIETYATEARLPGTLLIRIEEREPLATVRTDAGWFVVDAAGVSLEPGRGDDLATIALDADGVDGAAYDAAVRVLISLPRSVREDVRRIRATTLDDVRLTLRSTSTTVVWGNDEDSALKARVLRELLDNPDVRGAKVIDVASPLVPIWRF